MVEDFLHPDWPLIYHSGIVWIMDQRKFIGFAIIWMLIIERSISRMLQIEEFRA